MSKSGSILKYSLLIKYNLFFVFEMENYEKLKQNIGYKKIKNNFFRR